MATLWGGLCLVVDILQLKYCWRWYSYLFLLSFYLRNHQWRFCSVSITRGNYFSFGNRSVDLHEQLKVGTNLWYYQDCEGKRRLKKEFFDTYLCQSRGVLILSCEQSRRQHLVLKNSYPYYLHSDLISKKPTSKCLTIRARSNKIVECSLRTPVNHKGRSGYIAKTEQRDDNQSSWPPDGRHIG